MDEASLKEDRRAFWRMQIERELGAAATNLQSALAHAVDILERQERELRAFSGDSAAAERLTALMTPRLCAMIGQPERFAATLRLYGRA